MTIAVLFFGNAGAGKSTLLSQIGGNFKSGVKFRGGYTKNIYETWVKIRGRDALLMDVPGLFEPDDKETQNNANMLTEALSRGYNYKLYFVMKADNRGPGDAEMVMMARINQCVNQAGSKATFRIIVNQIADQEVYDMYNESMAQDNCKALFGSMDIEGYSFDIKVDNVLLIRFDKDAIQLNQLKEIIANDVLEHRASPVQLVRAIFARNEELKSFKEAFAQIMKQVWGHITQLFSIK
ncbi:hypothetical protein BGX26_009468 [Mortierella sp. AD094]|nr:hypothetical protein BGX26_009468 [Mortierella sp. AD094]